MEKRAGRDLILLAKEYLHSAERILKSGYIRLAIDAGYNSIELAIKALILRKIDDLPGSQGGVVGKFGELYVKTQEFPMDIGRKINLALELRNQARYKYQAVIKEEDAKGILELAKGMLEKAEK